MDDNEQMFGAPEVEAVDSNLNNGPVRLTEFEHEKVHMPKGVEPSTAAMTGPTMEGFRITSSLWRNIRLTANKRRLNKKMEKYNDKLHEVEKFTTRVEEHFAGTRLGDYVNSRRAQKAGKELSKLGVKLVDLQNKRARLEGKPKAIKVPSRVVETSKILQIVGWYKFQEKRAEKKIIREEVKKIVSDAKQDRKGDFSNLQQENLADFVIQKMKERGFAERETKARTARFSDEDHLDNKIIGEFRGSMIENTAKGPLTAEQIANYKAFCEQHGLDFDEEVSLAVDTNKALGIPVGVSAQARELTSMELAQRIKDSYSQHKDNFNKITVNTKSLNDMLKNKVPSILDEKTQETKQEKTDAQKAYDNLFKAEAQLRAHERSGMDDPQRLAELQRAVAEARVAVSRINENVISEADSIIDKHSRVIVDDTKKPASDKKQEEVKEEKPKTYKEQLEEAREDLFRDQKALNEYKESKLDNPELKASLEAKLEQSTKKLADLYTSSTRELKADEKTPEVKVEEPLDVTKLTMQEALQLIFPEAEELRSPMSENDLLNFRRDHALELLNIREQKEAAPEAEVYDRYRELELYGVMKNRSNRISEDRARSNPEYITELQEIHARQDQRAADRREEEQRPWFERREELMAANRAQTEATRKKIEANKHREQFRKLGSDYSSISDDDIIEFVTTGLNDKAREAVERQASLYDEIAKEVPKETYQNEERWHSAVVSAAKERFNQEQRTQPITNEEEIGRSK